MYNPNNPRSQKGMLTLGFCLIFLFFGSSNLQAQDPAFSQYYANPTYLNPAMAGSNECSRAGVHYRDQWPGLSGYKTLTASYDVTLPKVGGVGLLFMHDNAADVLKTQRVALQYAYAFQINSKLKMRVGMEGAYQRKHLDVTKLSFGQAINPAYGFSLTSGSSTTDYTSSVFDVSAGFFGSTKHVFFGGALHHINSPNESFYDGESRLPTKFTGHAGAEIPIEKLLSNMALYPNVLWMHQGGFNQLTPGLSLQVGPVQAGVAIRTSDAMIYSLGFKTKDFRVGYSYDYTISSLRNYSGGAHEIAAQFFFGCKQKSADFKELNFSVF